MISDSVGGEVYQGQFGTFTITDADRQGVKLYRIALAIAALCFASGSTLALSQLHPSNLILHGITAFYGGFWLALGVALMMIHIYLRPLHLALQIFWAIGGVASVAIAIAYPQPLILAVYQHPLTLLGIGFSFAALTGIFFKEAFCFNRFETKLLTPIVPLLLLGHLGSVLPLNLEQGLLAAWTILFLIFAGRKLVQPIPPDIGDKSVFDYLEQQRTLQQ
ncbi:MAG: DUF2301 domain-containing membrane protein [Cyanobacteria bacterium P01_A01_bin.123]